MKLTELRKISNELIEDFVDELGFSGKEYVSMTKCSMVFAELGNIPGMFLSAESTLLRSFLNTTNLDSKTKEYIYSEGLIVVNNKYLSIPIDEDLITTIIHEKLHANRMILAKVPDSRIKGVAAQFQDNGAFVSNSRKVKETYIDPAQDILLGSIDNSKVDYYKKLLNDKNTDLFSLSEKVDDKLIIQYKIDEALIELMARIAYDLSTGEYGNIMEIVEFASKNYSGDDIRAMARIILRHGDLELFRWMIDPLTYQADNIHYDYFSHYINDDDKEDVEIIKNSDEIMFDDDELDRIAEEHTRLKR